MKTSVIRMLPIDQLVTDGMNVGREQGDVSDLQESMESVGMLQPIVVRPVNGSTYELVAGHRRLKAAAAAGETEISCVVREMDEAQKWEARLAENLGRRNLTPSEEGRIYERLCLQGYTQREVAGMAHRSQSHIAKRIAFLSFPRDLIAKVDRGEVTMDQAERKVLAARHASAYLGKRGKALDRDRDEEVSVPQTRTLNIFTLEELGRFLSTIADDEWAKSPVRSKARQLLRAVTQALSTEQVGGGHGR